MEPVSPAGVRYLGWLWVLQSCGSEQRKRIFRISAGPPQTGYMYGMVMHWL
ncbi:hypothetical protein [Propionibacterium phage TCUCAP1]|nr:hypothetical protein [Propionibacterium phage TCUCAP1]